MLLKLIGKHLALLFRMRPVYIRTKIKKEYFCSDKFLESQTQQIPQK